MFQALLRKKELYGLLVIIGLMFYFILISLKYTYIGIEAHQRGDQGSWIITNIVENSWASHQGLAPGDTIVEIDHRSPSDNDTLSKFMRIERIQQLKIQHGNEQTAYSFENFQVSNLWLMHSILPFVVLLVTLVISVIVYRNQDGAVERDIMVLIAFSIIVAFSYVVAGASTRIDRLGLFVVDSAFPSIPTLLLHFIYLHARKNGHVQHATRSFVISGYSIVGLITACNAFDLYSGMRMPFPRAYLSTVILATFCLMNIVLLAVCLRRYAASSLSERPVYTILLIGQIIAFFPFVCLNALPKIIANVQIIPPELAATCVSIVPVMYLRLLTAKQLLDIDYALKRFRYFAVLAILPALLIVGLLYMIVQNESTWGVKWFQTFIVIYAVMILFLFLKESVDAKLRSEWLDDFGQFQSSLDRFTSQISRVMKPADLERMLIKEIQTVLRVKSVVLLELNMQSKVYRIKSAFGSPPDEATVAEIKQEVIRGTVGSFLPIGQGLCYWFASSNSNETLQLLWIHNKYNSTRFNQDELAWLRTLLNYGTLVYENLLLVDDFIGELEQSIAEDKRTPTWLLRLLFSISENERRRLSTDLHDSALQDQILWYQHLEDLGSRHALSKPVLQDVERICNGLLDVIDQIRETCNELRPPFLKEMGIVEAIRQLLSKARLRADFSIKLMTDEYQAGVKLDDHQALMLYRIVQELLHNAGKHSKATRIDLVLSGSDEMVSIQYADNGVGMNMSQLRSSFSHMGLWSIQERVASLEGTVLYRSEPGQGFQVDIAVPVLSASHIRAFDSRTGH